MFESILEKVLQKQLGKFISGIDSNNLHIGVWSGCVVIENVSIKPDVLEMLELPIRLKFSSIGKLSLQVPWKALSSSPVEVNLEGVYLIVCPKNKSEWTFVDYNTIQKKIELIEKFINEYIKKISDKEKLQQGASSSEDDKQASYTEKLTMKVVDNLQVKIKSIHVRFENDLNNVNYSCGITLDELEVFTVDDKGQKKFLDRTIAENKGKPMKKQLRLSNLGIYWNAEEKKMLTGLPNEKGVVEYMNDSIRRKDKNSNLIEYVITISADAKMQQNQVKNFDQPEISAAIDLDFIDVSLSKTQLQQIILIAEFFSSFQTKMLEKRKMNNKIDSSTLNKHQETFIGLFEKIQRHKEKSMKALNAEETKKYETILEQVESEVLFEWCKKVIKKVFMEEKLQAMEEEKKKKNKGWFGGWFGKGSGPENPDELINQDDKAKLNTFLNDTLSDESLNMPKVLRPPEYVWFILNFNLKGGSVHLKRKTKSEITEGVKLSYKTFKFEAKLRDKNKVITLNLSEFNIDLTNKKPDQAQEEVSNFLKKNQLIVAEDKSFLSFEYEQAPLKALENQVLVDSKITLDIQSCIIIFNPSLISRMTQFADVKVQSDELKDAAWERIEKISDETQASVQSALANSPILSVKIDLASPVIVIPFAPNGDPSNECWIMNLGNLKVVTNDSILDAKIKAEEKFYDIYDIVLSQIKMQYYPSFHLFEAQLLKKTQEDITKILTEIKIKDRPCYHYDIIEDFTINISVNLLKAAVENMRQDTASTSVKGEIPGLSLKLKQEMYWRLLKMSDCFAIPEGEAEEMEKAQLDRIQLMKSCKKVGEVWKRGGTLHNWKKYSGVLSGSYLYLFANPKDMTPESFIYVRDSTVTMADESIGMKNAFLVLQFLGLLLFFLI